MAVGPFTQFYNEAQAAYLKQHPEAAKEPVEPLIQIMLDQEAATAKDFAEGRITPDEYSAFQARCQAEVDSFRSNMHEAGVEIIDNFSSWAHGASDEFEALKQDHPDVIQAIESGHVTATQAAEGAEFVVNIAEPLMGVALDSVEVAVDHISESLTSSAAGIVEARNALSCVDETEREANNARLDAAQADWDSNMTKAHDSLETAHAKVDAEFDRAREGVEALHDYAAEHPVVEIMQGQTIDAPDVDQHIHDQASVADA